MDLLEIWRCQQTLAPCPGWLRAPTTSRGCGNPGAKAKPSLGTLVLGFWDNSPIPSCPCSALGWFCRRQESDSCEGEVSEGGLGRTNPQDVQGWQAVNLSKLCQDPGRKSRKVQSLWLHTPEVAAGTINLLPFLNL